MPAQKRQTVTRRISQAAISAKCGLCGKTRKLTRTECCENWICDDEDKYVLFSYARNSCDRNHRRYTLCGHHHTEEHPGRWTECKQCRGDVETEMYVWYGTNEYNFEKLQNPPVYQPTLCSKCSDIIVLSEGGYSMQGGKYLCEKCTEVRNELDEKMKIISRYDTSASVPTLETLTKIASALRKPAAYFLEGLR